MNCPPWASALAKTWFCSATLALPKSARFRPVLVPARGTKTCRHIGSSLCGRTKSGITLRDGSLQSMLIGSDAGLGYQRRQVLVVIRDDWSGAYVGEHPLREEEVIGAEAVLLDVLLNRLAHLPGDREPRYLLGEPPAAAVHPDEESRSAGGW